MPGVEYRQAQTALSAYWIKQEGKYTLAYPTPVLGKPWSIPMEFPLYQWLVVEVDRLTGLGLTKAGRMVSIVCFYLMLPAVFLLLGRWGVPLSRRWLVLALVVSCPLYIFYSRAFLIETMALMFSIWFWVGLEKAVETRKYLWLIVAVGAGCGAGLVKVTTLMLYLLPIAAWAGVRLWRSRNNGRWRGDLTWMTIACVVPFAVTWWWVWKADQIKALNPVADFLGSVHMRRFNLGDTELRFSPELWAMKWRIIQGSLTELPLLGLSFLGLLVGGWQRVRAVLACGLIFVAALWIFPVLYAYHDYYYVASTLALLLAAGLALLGLVDQARWRWLGYALAGLIVVGQMRWYTIHYRPIQQAISNGGGQLTDVLRGLTKPGDVLVVTGQDWNSMTAYYSQRRVLMLRGDAEADVTKINRAMDNLADEKIGALVVTGEKWTVLSALLGRLTAMGMSDRPLLRSSGSWLFFPQDREPSVIETVRTGSVPGVEWAPGAEPASQPLAGQWHNVADLPLYQQALFASMSPVPVRFFCTYEPCRQVREREISYFAHPVTRLVFRLAQGEHVLRLAAWFSPDAYRPPAGESPTDGVEVRLSNLNDGGETEILNSRLVNPAGSAADCGPVPIEFRFTLERAEEVELMLGAGPKGLDTRDWIWLRGPLVFE